MKTMIAIPCMDTVQTEFAQSLVNMKTVGEVQYAFLACSLIYKSRNDLADMAVKAGADFILWLDSDVIFPNSLMVDLMADMKDGVDLVTGIYHMRRPPFKPVIWKKLRQGLIPQENESEDWDDYPKDDVFEIDGCGFGCVLMRTEMLQPIVDRYHDLFGPVPGYGEDLSFCVRARSCGFKLIADPKIQVGHKGSLIISDESFEAYRKAGGKT